MPFDTGLPLVAEERDPLFDLTIRGLRSTTFKFLLEDLTGVQLGEINPLRNSTPTLSHDTTRSVKRTINLTLDVADSLRFDEILHRIRVFMVLEDGREFPLGRYMSASISRLVTSAGDFASIALVDEMFVVAQPIPSSFGVAIIQAGFISDGLGRSSVYLGIQEFLDRYILFNPEGEWGGGVVGLPQAAVRMRARERNIEFTDFASGAVWQSGTAGTSVLEDLATGGDYFSPWMGNDGTFRMIRTFDPEDVAPAYDLDEQDTVYRDSITRTNDLLNAPNRIVVVSNSGTGDSSSAPVVGTYDIPNAAPHSVQNRGFLITDVITMQIATRAQANAIARNIAINQRVAERVELTTPPDPRHDSYDVVRWDGNLWLEVAWSMALVEGGGMRHTLQRIFL
jgi:hypothetical protein